MKTNFFPLLITIVFLLIFFIFYRGLSNSNVYKPDLDFKKDIPIFNAKNFYDDKMIYSREIFKKNKFYLMNIWASWCVPCREEHSYLLNLSNNHSIEIVGLNYKDKKYNAKKFLKEFNSPYKVIFSDNDGTIAIEWGAYGVPETFVIYNEKIIKKFIGPLNENSVKEIKKLLK